MRRINERHGRLVDGLLLLAYSERQVTEHSYMDLADIVDQVAVSDTVKVVTDAAEAAVIGNPVLLERLVQNLVENGVRHNVEQAGWVHVRTTTTPDGWVLLEVATSGPVVRRYEVPSLFEPPTGTGRSGCTHPAPASGCRSCAAVARAHRGDVRAYARDEGGRHGHSAAGGGRSGVSVVPPP